MAKDAGGRGRGLGIWPLVPATLSVAIWAAAPAYHARAGRHDEASWIPLVMAPTGVACIVLCMAAARWRTRWLLAAAWLALSIHLLVALGLHPR